MKNSIYSPTGKQKISSVCSTHKVTRATIPIVDPNNSNLKSSFINKSINVSSGTTVLVSGVENCIIEVNGYVVSAASAGTMKFMSGATDITGTMNIGANGSISINSNNAVFTCATAQNLSIVTNTSINGHISYRVI